MEYSLRKMYEQNGVDEYYKKNAENYYNPHYDIIKKFNFDDIGENVLDLCCGSGEITKIINAKNIIGLDPYMNEIYERNTNKKCLKYSFKDIVQGKLNEYYFDTIICSFAMHLCENSMLNTLLYQLSCISNQLIIITPHKRPICEGNYWKLEEINKIDKVTMKRYKKINNIENTI